VITFIILFNTNIFHDFDNTRSNNIRVMLTLRLKKYDEEQFDRVKNHPKFAMLKIKLGKRGAMDALLHELNMGDSERSLPK
jgi:hypothetical protein